MNRSPFRNQKEALAFLKKIGMKKRRTLTGVEREHMLLIFALIGPIDSSNNQRTFSETYHHCGKEYDVTYGFSDSGEPDPIVEELTELKE
jgi:hypothetical protein